MNRKDYMMGKKRMEFTAQMLIGNIYEREVVTNGGMDVESYQLYRVEFHFDIDEGLVMNYWLRSFGSQDLELSQKQFDEMWLKEE